MVNWVSVDDAMPENFRTVLVEGGCAYWDGIDWYTYMESTNPRIMWDVRCWAPLPKPPPPCSGCEALKAKLAELKRLWDRYEKSFSAREKLLLRGEW